MTPKKKASKKEVSRYRRVFASTGYTEPKQNNLLCIWLLLRYMYFRDTKFVNAASMAHIIVMTLTGRIYLPPFLQS